MSDPDGQKVEEESVMPGMSNDQMCSLLIKLTERVEAVQDDVHKLSHVILEGNGRPAMTVQVATMDTRLKVLEDDVKERKVPRHVWMGIIFSVAIAVAGFVFQLKN